VFFEARAEVKKKIRSIFGSYENLKICFEIYPPLGSAKDEDFFFFQNPCHIGLRLRQFH
jgi:hypothetical protein